MGSDERTLNQGNASRVSTESYEDQHNSTRLNANQTIFLTQYSEEIFKDPFASGVAYINEGMGFVRNNYQYSILSLSHEILHLGLKAQGYSNECFGNMVHQNQYNSAIVNEHYVLIKKFECS